ncbi:MAG: hypothetical protein ACFE9C_11400 [Candidatus Hodarchaeota archaeon]
MDKKKVLYITGLVNIVILIAILINIIVVFPLTAENAWIYGLYIIVAGLSTYLIGLFLVEGYRLETIGTVVVIIGEIFVISFFALALRSIWVSVFVIFPVITFSVLIIIAYYHSKEILPNRNAYNISLMLISGSFFFLMVEAAFRIPDFFQATNIPIWALILIAGGLLIYVFTTWKILEKPSYIMALTGAFIINIGVLMIELHYGLHEITGIFMLIFLPPAAVFLLLIYINYKISPYD